MDNPVDYNDDSIVTMSALQHYRFRPTMYGFQVANIEGCLLQCKELVDNSVDEVLPIPKVYPILVTFFVSKDKSTYQCMVQDFGRGIPCKKLEDALSKANTSGKYNASIQGTKDSYASGPSIGSNGVGSKVVAALSKTMIAFSKRLDGFAYLKMYQGEVKDSQVRRAIDKNADTVGTTVLFQPDDTILLAIKEMFGKPSVEGEKNGYEILLERLTMYPLFRSNMQIKVRIVEGMLKPADLNKEPVELWKFLTDDSNFKFSTEWETQLGLTPRDYVIRKFNLKQPIWDLGMPLVKLNDEKNESDRLSFNIDVFIDEKSLKEDSHLVAAVNSTPIDDPGSIHITMLQSVLKMYLDGFIIDKDKQAFFENKYRIPYSGFVSAGWRGAAYDGQDKKKFTDKIFGDAYRVFLRRQLNKVPEATWERLYELITEHFEQAYAKYARSQFKVGSDLKGMAYRLKRMGSYIPCESRDSDIIELYIVEGDSAGGRVKTVRDGKTQAIFKLSGKPTNPLRADPRRLVKDLIFADLMDIIGVRPTDTDLSNMKFSKIIILTDADADGEHITALLAAIIYKINPKILEEGRVFFGCPPLYSFFVRGQNRPFYLRDQAALQQCKNIIYKQLLSIYIKPHDGRGEIKLEGDVFDSLCYVVDEVGDRIKYVAGQLNINPMDLERMLHVVDYITENPDVKAMKKVLGVDNVTFNKSANTLTLDDGGIDITIPLAHLRESMETRILPLYEQFGWKNFDLFLTTNYTDLYIHTPCTFMMLHTVFENITGTTNSNAFIIRRFKGLGEMDEDQIDDTCVNPLTRTLIRIVGIGDVKRIYDLLGNDSASRKILINTDIHEKLVNEGFLDK